MKIDFGTIQKYDTEKGFGFIESTLYNKQSPRGIFFHITTIRRKCYELAHKLDSGSYNNVSFWYEIEKGNKGEEVSKLWLNVEEIPTKELNEIRTKIEGLWHDINTDTPDYLDQITLLLFGKIRRDELFQERQRLKDERRVTQKEEEAEFLKDLERLLDKKFLKIEQENKQKAQPQKQIQAIKQVTWIAQEQDNQDKLTFHISEIKKICQTYEIEVLVHFTHITNLNSILQNGLLGRAELESMSWVEPPKYNDAYRLDGQPKAICLSISFPNYKMFYKYSVSNRSDWVILLLKPSILWELDCKFYQENAASNNSRENVLEKETQAKKQPQALKNMFSDYGNIKREILEIPNNYTTHPQAEVLVFNRIHTQYIDEVHFYNVDAGNYWLEQNPGNYSQEFYGGYSYYFSPREDWEMW